VDCLINDAGFGDYGAFSTTDLARQEGMIGVNITALTGLTRLFLPALLERVLWPREGGIVDLETVGDDVLSLAFGINDHRQVAGQSIGAGGSRAFLWQDGVITDLNTLTEPGSPYLIYANDVNDRGEIVGQGCDPCAGESFAVKLIPK
jgi:probable HAF family extracellular repeat protein